MNLLSDSLSLRPSRIAVVALAGYDAFLAPIIVLHAHSVSGYSPLSQTLSEYALGPSGHLMTLAFFLFGGGTLALAFALHRLSQPRSTLTIALLLTLAFGIFLAGIFPTDPDGGPRTPVGLVHDLASMVGLLSGMAAAVLFTAKMEKDPSWRAIYRPASILALGAPITFLMWVLVFGPLDMAGLGQRLFLASLMAWLIMVAGFLWLHSKQ